MNSPPFSKNHNFLPSQTTPLSDFLYSYEKKDEENTNKENLDPFNKLITPLKSKSKNLHNSSSRNLNRSPLQDITPPLASKKNKETQVFY